MTQIYSLTRLSALKHSASHPLHIRYSLILGRLAAGHFSEIDHEKRACNYLNEITQNEKIQKIQTQMITYFNAKHCTSLSLARVNLSAF